MNAQKQAKKQGLNLCHQFMKWQRENKMDFDVGTHIGKATSDASSAAFYLAMHSQKFNLPDGGILIDDSELRALDDDAILTLPFDSIALEYIESRGAGEGQAVSTKRIVFASQYEDIIIMAPVSYFDREKAWFAYPPVSIPRSGYRNRAAIPGKQIPINIEKSIDDFSDQDYGHELMALISTLNALQCSNVSISKHSSSKKLTPKAALKFDDFHLLEISNTLHVVDGINRGGTHRSPREHLRRGHIRRLETGKKIWVNAAVIGAGRGAGKIAKHYTLN